MPVVINEFEVVAEPSSAPQPASASAQSQPERAQLDLDRELAIRRARYERVRAY